MPCSNFATHTLDGCLGYAPSQMLHSRLLKSRLPTASTLLTPHVVPPIYGKLKERQVKQKHFYDRKASRNIEQPAVGQQVRFRCPNSKWDYGIVKADRPEPRNILIETPDGSIYRRNRRQSFMTRENPPVFIPDSDDLADINVSPALEEAGNCNQMENTPMENAPLLKDSEKYEMQHPSKNNSFVSSYIIK